MAKSRMFHFPKWSLVEGDIKVDVNLNRFEKQFQDAQWFLDTQIMQSMKPYMPFNEGNFYNTTKIQSDALAGSGKVVAAAGPFGRYLYMGKVMVDSETGKGPMNIPGVGLRFREGARLVATDRPLTYSNPKATPHWFDTAKDVHGKAWVKEVKKIAGGGKK